MVVGLDIFKKYFEQYPDNYIIIGGTACDIIIGEAGFTPRATKEGLSFSIVAIFCF